MGETKNAYKILLGNPDRKRQHGRPKRRWEDNIKMNLREIVLEGEDSIYLTQDRDRWRDLVNRIMNLPVP
jgi:hypothetical protein